MSASCVLLDYWTCVYLQRIYRGFTAAVSELDTKEEGFVLFPVKFSNKEYSSGREAVLSQTACFLSFLLCSLTAPSFSEQRSKCVSECCYTLTETCKRKVNVHNK